MNRTKFLSTLCFFLIGLNTFSQVNFTKEAILADLDSYRDSIILRHKNPFTHISKDLFISEIESLKSHAEQYSPNELFVEWLKVNARLGDEHTGLDFDMGTMFPIRAFIFEEGWFIIQTDSANRQALYCRIRKINGIDIDSVFNKIKDLIPGENKNALKEKAPIYLLSPVVLNGLKITNDTNQLPLLLEDSNGVNFEYSIRSVENYAVKLLPPEKLKQLLRFSVRRPYWYTCQPEDHYVYFNYSKCANDKRYPIDVFQEELIDTIKSLAPVKVIVDLRENSGGNSSLLNPFIDHIGSLMRSDKIKLYVLIGRRTYSSGLLNAIDLNESARGMLVGEETSGSVNHFGELKCFNLPATHLNICYSTKYFKRNGKVTGALIPDVQIPVRFSDFMKINDAALNYIIKQ